MSNAFLNLFNHSVARNLCKYSLDSSLVCRSQGLSSLFPSSWVKDRSLSFQFHRPQCIAPLTFRAILHTAPPDDATHKSSRRRRVSNKQSPKPESRIQFDGNAVNSAFGNAVDSKAGVSALQILQDRRVTGSLIEYGVYIVDSEVSEPKLRQGLQWLRQHFPIDEKAAAEEWADKETTEVEAHFEARAQELGLYKSDSEDTHTIQQDVYSRPGNRSVLDDMRIYNEDKAREAEEQREKSGEAQRSRDLQLAKSSEAERQAKEYAIALAEHRERQYEDGRIFTGEMPDMTLSQRLVPSTLFAICFIASAFYLADAYVPPAQADRIWDDIPPTIATLTALGLGMAFITCAWHVPKFWKTMNTYLVSVPALPHPVSMLGNIFSHQTFRHLIANTSFFWLYGISVHEDIGRGNFIAIFCTGGVFGSLTSLSYHVLKGNIGATMCGASGGIAAVIFAWLYLNATNPEGPLTASTTFLSTAKWVGYATIAVQIPLHLWPGVGQTIDVVAHLGGAIAGLIGAAVVKWRLQSRSKLEQSKYDTIINADP